MKFRPIQQLLGIRVAFSSGTGSMGQLLQQGDIMIYDVIPFNQVKVGDIIAYQRNGAPRGVIHRVVRIDDDQIFTKGDSNDYIDDPVIENEYHGVLRRTIRAPLLSSLALIQSLKPLLPKLLSGRQKPTLMATSGSLQSFANNSKSRVMVSISSRSWNNPKIPSLFAFKRPSKSVILWCDELGIKDIVE